MRVVEGKVFGLKESLVEGGRACWAQGGNYGLSGP